MQAKNIFRSVLFVFLLLLPLRVSAATASPSTDYYREGVELFKKGDYGAAEAKFLEAVRYSPCYSLGYYGLGRVYLHDAERIDDAIKNLQRSVELDANLAKGYFYLGLAEYIGNRSVEALHSFSTAYEKDRRFIESLYNIGVIYDELGNTYRAFTFYRRYMNELKGRERPF